MPTSKPRVTDKNTTISGGVLPELTSDTLGTYTLQVGDSLESIALQVYGDSSLWYMLADANGITDRYAHAGEVGSQLRAGQRLNLPQASGNHHTSQTQLRHERHRSHQQPSRSSR